jgi:glutathione S-transferase
MCDVRRTYLWSSDRKRQAVFDAVCERLSDGRPFLFGVRFTAADLTFSAMAAPMLMPPGYGVPLQEPQEGMMAAVVDELRTHPAGIHALALFATQRR